MSDAPAAQLASCLRHLSSNSSAATALLQVIWFRELASAAATSVHVSTSGLLKLAGAPSDPSHPPAEQADASHVLASLLDTLAQQAPGVADHLLAQLLPQLLQCQHAHGSGGAWVNTLCQTAAALHAANHPAAQQLSASCVEQLESYVAACHLCAPTAGAAVTVGQHACLQLLAALLQPPARTATDPASHSNSKHRAITAAAADGVSGASGLQPELLQRLLDCVIPQLTTGHPLSKALQATLIAPLMAAAAAGAAAAAPAAAGPDAAPAASVYSRACERLLQAVCAGGSTSSGSSRAESSRVSESLALACRLQPHLLLALCGGGGCGGGTAGGCRAQLHGLLLSGLLHGDLHSRQRAAHLLEACCAAGCAPEVLSEEQWQGYLLLYRAEEQHMLHLIQPLWAQWFAQLWQGNSNTSSTSSTTSSAGSSVNNQQLQQQEAQDGSVSSTGSTSAALVAWCSVLVLRAAFHPNVGVRRLGLSGLFQLSTPTLQQLVGHGGWQGLQALLLQLLPAFDDRKLVSAAAGGSASSRQAEAVTQLREPLGHFLCSCMQLLLQCQQQGQQVLQLLVQYLEAATAAGDKAATLLFLLQALADGVTAAALTPEALLSSSSSSSSDTALLPSLTRVLSHAEFVNPAYLRPQICNTLLQLVPHCLLPSAVGPSGVLSLLAAASPLTAAAAAAAADLPSGGSAAQQQQQLQQIREVFLAGSFVQWLQAALTAPGSSSAAAAPSAGSADLMCLLGSSTGSSTAAVQQHSALYCLGLLSAELCQQLWQDLVAALETAAQDAAASGGQPLQQQQQQQQQHDLVSAAWLLAGMLRASAADTGATEVPQQQQQQLVSCTAAVLPVLLAHHLRLCTSQTAATYDPQWCGALVAVVSAAAAAAAAAGNTQAGSQLQCLLQLRFSEWLTSLTAWLTAAAQPTTPLQQQLVLLTAAHVACFALPLQQPAVTGGSSGSIEGGVGGSSDSSSQAVCANQAEPQPAVSPGVLEVCLQQLCQLTPSKVFAEGDSSSSSSTKAEVTEQLLQMHASVLRQVVTAATPCMSQQTRQAVFSRCVEDLEWCTQHTLQQLLHTLLLTAPFLSQVDRPQPVQQEGGSISSSSSASHAAASTEQLEQLRGMLQLLQPLVRSSSSKRFSSGEVALLSKVFFHPTLFSCRELTTLLTQQLIPFALSQGGARLSVGVMSHLCSAVLAPQPQLLQELLPHITHLAAFSLFAESVTQPAALQQQKCDVSVLLPSRVVLCGFLVQLASSGHHTDFINSLVSRLLLIAAAPSGSPYAWLGSREASQSSGANAIRVAVWQTLCLLGPHIPQQQLPQVLQQAWSCLLCSHQHGNIRPHVQLFVLVLFSRHPIAVPELLLPGLNTFSTTSYQVTVSIIILGMFVLLELGPSSPQFLPLLHALLPWALHHRHAVRVPVQVMLHVTFQRHMQDIQHSLGKQDAHMLQQVHRFLVENDEVAKLRERQGLVDLQGFDLAAETSLPGVFGVRQSQLEQLCDGESDSTGLQWPLHVRDRLPLDLLSCLPGALKAVGDRRGAAGAAHGAAAAAAAADDGGSCAADAEEGEQGAAAPGGREGTAIMHQFRPQIQGSLFEDAAADWADALVAERAGKRGLIVCASLLENLPNLAGLCRTCESMSAEALVVPSRAVVQTDAFKKQSRTSERWLRILEVGIPDLATFLQEKREAGYTIIGIEQATGSVQLQDYRFPQLCVLVLGNEQSGMPVDVLPLLDVCVEVPMLGVTRSLNAHVCGAMALWQYTQQQLEGGGGSEPGAVLWSAVGG